MFKTLNWLLPIIFIMFFLSSCIFDIDDDFGGCIRADGPIRTAEFNLNDFDGIDLAIDAEVYIRQGEFQTVEVQAQDEALDQLETRVRSGIWRIEYDRCIRREDRVRIFITVPEITYLKISGSGKIVSENVLVTDDLVISIEGSGDIDLALDSDDIEANISGSGAIALEGIADVMDCNVSGSGDFRCFPLEVRRANVRISGSGDIEVYVLDQLDVRITGSGDVFYRGIPNLNISVSGSGDVVDAN
ncbi:MAG: head GIN domain-containing protein [Bacteroidota bacterium]